ncbi:MAG: GIY-YIG nuclease family protein [Candidatus Nomurabacteria bacterium]|nr:MAG: GIY-YIG nuclease family protein [Candidatus Nomurabacteria bacterium]
MEIRWALGCDDRWINDYGARVSSCVIDCKEKERKELEKPGVYILVNPKEEGLQKIYIGEGDPIIDRLLNHERNKDFWSKVICFTTTDQSLNKTHIQYLESRLIQIAKEYKIADLENSNSPGLPSISESEQAVVERFFTSILKIAPILGVDAFEEPPTSYSGVELSISAKGVKAFGHVTNQGFLVLKGSEAVINEVPSLSNSMHVLREGLIQRSVLVPTDEGKYVFSQDFDFGSPSTAATVVLGHSSNGRLAWKSSNGKSLADLEAMDYVNPAGRSVSTS